MKLNSMPFELDGCRAEMKAILPETLNIQDPKFGKRFHSPVGNNLRCPC